MIRPASCYCHSNGLQQAEPGPHQRNRMNIDKYYDLPFSTKQVYAAWTCPQTIIPPATRMEIDPTVGGHYRLFIEEEDRCSRAEGLIFAIEPERHVRFTWERDRDGEITEVELFFTPTQNGSTLRIRHFGFNKQETRDMHDTGWDNYVTQLSQFLQKEDEAA